MALVIRLMPPNLEEFHLGLLDMQPVHMHGTGIVDWKWWNVRLKVTAHGRVRVLQASLAQLKGLACETRVGKTFSLITLGSS